MGAGADSFYEYLLKVGIYIGKNEGQKYIDEYVKTIKAMERSLLQHSGDITYLSQNNGGYMEQLACFLPGNMLLGKEFI